MSDEATNAVSEAFRGRRIQVKEEPFNTYATCKSNYILTCCTGTIQAAVNDIYYSVLHDDGKLFAWKPEELEFLDD